MTELAYILAQVEPFNLLNANQRQAVAENALRQSIRKGEFLAMDGDDWPYLFVVCSGALDAIKESAEGRSLIVVSLEAGDLFWGLGFFDPGLSQPVSFLAREDGALALWTQETLLPILQSNGRMLWTLCQVMVRRMLRASEIVDGLAFQPVAGRLAHLLMDQLPEHADQPIARDLTLDDMAARVGTTREMVCRLLYRFADDDLIHITRTEYSIIDQDRLAQLAGE